MFEKAFKSMSPYMSTLHIQKGRDEDHCVMSADIEFIKYSGIYWIIPYDMKEKIRFNTIFIKVV